MQTTSVTPACADTCTVLAPVSLFSGRAAAGAQAARSAALKVVGSMMAIRFSPEYTRRSDAYQRGVRSILELRLCAIKLPNPPYPEGSAKADAYWSGQAEGRLLAPARQGGAA